MWSWFPWAALAVYFVSRHDWWCAAGVGAWSAICSLSSPMEFPPQFGLDHSPTVGTTNFDSRSFSHNEESNICLRDADFSRELNAMFAEDAAVCERVTLEGWRARPLTAKVLQGLASFFQDQV